MKVGIEAKLGCEFQHHRCVLKVLDQELDLVRTQGLPAPLRGLVDVLPRIIQVVEARYGEVIVERCHRCNPHDRKQLIRLVRLIHH